MKANVGSAVELDDRFVSPTSWGAKLFILAEEVTRIGACLVQVENKLKPFKSMEENSLRDFDPAAAKETSQQFLQVLTLVMKRIKQLAPEVEDLKASISEMKRTHQAA